MDSEQRKMIKRVREKKKISKVKLPSKGKLVLKDAVYEGSFNDSSEFHGKGKMTYNDGRVYEGDFANCEYHGKGKMTYPDGRIEEGNWENGVFVK